MKACVVQENFNQLVKVWLFNDVPEGRIYMWPAGWDHKHMTWMQEIVAHEQGIPDTIRPALEMNAHMWDAFKAALLEDIHMRVDALDIVAKTLEREQNRVDALIHALIKNTEPSLYIQATGGLVDGD